MTEWIFRERGVPVACDAYSLCKLHWLHCDHYAVHGWRGNCMFECPFEADAVCVVVKEVVKKMKWWQFFTREKKDGKGKVNKS
jgi:hypothetical protein